MNSIAGPLLAAVQPAEDRDGEHVVLAQAIRDMDRWISRLPAASTWRTAFVTARRHLADAANVRPVSLVRTPPQESPKE